MSIELSKNADEYRRRICRAIDFINAHLADSLTMDEIARAAAFSRFHFQRLFHALVGETVAEFIRRIRLESAARRLRFRPHEEVTQVAVDWGFSSSQNFAKAFKNEFGVTPTEYRAQSSQPGVRIAPSTIDSQVFEQSLRSDGESRTRVEQAVVVQKLPCMRVVYRRHFGSYNEPGVEAAFAEMRRWAAARDCDLLERYLGIPWDDADITQPDRCRFDACLIVTDEIRLDGMNSQEIPAGRYAVYSCEVVHRDFDLPWTKLMRDWLPHSGFQPADGPRFEQYLSDGSHDPDGRWKIAACLPVEPLGS